MGWKYRPWVSQVPALGSVEFNQRVLSQKAQHKVGTESEPFYGLTGQSLTFVEPPSAP